MRVGKTPITNRSGQTMYVRYEPPQSNQRGLAIIQHGYGSSMDSPHIIGMARVFQACGYATLSLDCTHSFNPGDGEIQDHSIQTHLHDLYDAIEWAKDQKWYTSPFALAGHSLGGYTVLHYAEDNPQDVSLLFPCSAVTSGKRLERAFQENLPADIYENWRDTGFMEVEAWDGSGRRGLRPYSWLDGMKKYDALEHADKLTMPVLLVVGSDDIPTPPRHQLDLYSLLPEKDKEMHILPGSDHPFTKPEHRRKMEEILKTWLEKHQS